MTHKQTEHAARVVEHFKAMLSQSGREHVGQGHFEELSLMIESAISAALLEQGEHLADRLEEIAKSVRESAEHFD
jgi:predicted Co/Zn/Cd cation transporter (cation efflux family)